MRARYERLQEENAEKEAALKENAEKEAALKAVNDRQRVEIEGLRQHNAEMEPDEDSWEEYSEAEDSEEENELGL